MCDASQVGLLAVLFFNLVFSMNTNIFDDSYPVVQTKYGKVKGHSLTSRQNRTFYAFQGIPFAAPPTGLLRFKAPVPPIPWIVVRDATKDGPMCIQKNYLYSLDPPIEGEEDCLYINVYTPKVFLFILSAQNENASLLPVMVYIHHSGFFAGTGNSDYIGPHYLMDKDVIFVSFNHRLAAF
ncbi:hypothetical protein ILUMI_16954, partial [Ignelater luminosus]